tara:strand:+ start:220 stop:483 length:264 start_codon:yes stop_codon:yes gene_type:complete
MPNDISRNHNVITPQTLRAARAGINWSQIDLATAAGIHPKSVAYHERGLASRTDEAAPVLSKMVDALQAQGVLIDGETVMFKATHNQ